MFSKKIRFCALLFVALSLFTLFTGCGEKKNDDLEVTPEKPLEQTEQTVSYKEYEKNSFFYLTGLQIPENWYYEDTANGFALIENRTGTEIDFIISDYYPEINNMNIDLAKSSLTSDTTSFVSFQKTAGNQLFFKYYLKVNNVQYAACEVQKFNYKYIYTLRLICEEKFYEKFYPIFEDVVKSLKMSADIKTLPEGYNGMYNAGLKTLTVYPREWKTSVGADYYTASYSKSSVTMTFSKPIQNFAGMDKTTYNGVMQKTVQNFSTSAFSNQNGVITAEGYYTSDSIRYLVYNTIYNFKGYSLNIIYVAPENEVASFMSVYQTMVQHLVIYQ